MMEISLEDFTAALDVLIDRQVDFGQKRGLGDENEVMVFGEVFEEQA